MKTISFSATNHETQPPDSDKWWQGPGWYWLDQFDEPIGPYDAEAEAHIDWARYVRRNFW